MVGVLVGVRLGVFVGLGGGCVNVGVAVGTGLATPQPPSQTSTESKPPLAQPTEMQKLAQATRPCTLSTQKPVPQVPLLHTQHMAAAGRAPPATVTDETSSSANRNRHARRPPRDLQADATHGSRFTMTSPAPDFRSDAPAGGG